MSSIRNKSHKKQPIQLHPEPREKPSGFGQAVFYLCEVLLRLLAGMSFDTGPDSVVIPQSCMVYSRPVQWAGGFRNSLK